MPKAIQEEGYLDSTKRYLTYKQFYLKESNYPSKVVQILK